VFLDPDANVPDTGVLIRMNDDETPQAQAANDTPHYSQPPQLYPATHLAQQQAYQMVHHSQQHSQQSMQYE
jgi:hypothetical protein